MGPRIWIVCGTAAGDDVADCTAGVVAAEGDAAEAAAGVAAGIDAGLAAVTAFAACARSATATGLGQPAARQQ